MSLRVLTLVWDNFSRGGSEKLAMLALADWCNDDGKSLHPSISAVAKKINASESQARRIIHKFIDEGYLTVVGNFNGGDPGQARQYILNLEKLSRPLAPMRVTPSAHDTPSMTDTPSAHAHRPLAPMRVTPSAHDTLTTNEPSIEPLIKNKTPRKAVIFDSLSYLTSRDVEKSVATDFLTLRKQKRAAPTETALAGICREADKAGITLQAALETCCKRGWQGFEAQWLESGNGARASPVRNGNQRRPTPAEIMWESCKSGLDGITLTEGKR